MLGKGRARKLKGPAGESASMRPERCARERRPGTAPHDPAGSGRCFNEARAVCSGKGAPDGVWTAIAPEASMRPERCARERDIIADRTRGFEVLLQ